AHPKSPPQPKPQPNPKQPPHPVQEETMARADESPAGTMMTEALNALDAFRPEAMQEAYGRMMDRYRSLNETCLASMHRTRVSGGGPLARSRQRGDPAEAMTLYQEWLKSRQAALTTDGKSISEHLMKLYEFEPMSMGMNGPRAGSSTH